LFDRERFRALIESYGSRPANWPSEERERAEAFLASSPEAAAWLAEQRELDQWLDSAAKVEASASVLRAIAEIPLRHPQRSFWSRWSPRGALAALGAAAVLGVLAGMVTPDQLFDETDTLSDDELSFALNVDLSDEVSP
jgi:anti-sigma factor RsiW